MIFGFIAMRSFDPTKNTQGWEVGWVGGLLALFYR